MASIIKRKKNYSVVYNYVDENGETKQKWETWHTHKEALKRKAEIENQQHTGTFLPPSNQTITEFLYDFVSLYGEKKWGVSMYDSQTALIANYINPIIGDMEVQAVTPRAVDGYIQTLQKTKSVSTKTRKAVTTYVSDKTIEKIIKLLRCAFKQAVRWEIIARNPFDNVILPKTEYAKRNIWTADMIRLALDKCTQSSVRTQDCRRWSFILSVIQYHLQIKTEPRRSESHSGRYGPCRDRHDNQYLCSHSGRG